MSEKSIGVFSSIGKNDKNIVGEVKSLVLTNCPEDSSDTIYNLLFKDYDMDKDEEKKI